jgi:hypothetical protein
MNLFSQIHLVLTEVGLAGHFDYLALHPVTGIYPIKSIISNGQLKPAKTS